MDKKIDLTTDVKKGTFGQKKESIYDRDDKIWTSWDITKHCALNPTPNYNHTAYVRENWILARQEVAFLEELLSRIKKITVRPEQFGLWASSQELIKQRIKRLTEGGN